jgi:16S rRNA processing protein RimM
MDITIGRVVNFHGIKGEVKIVSDSDFTAERFAVGNIVKIDNQNYEISSYRVHKNFHLLKFKGIKNINQVKHLKGQDVLQDDDSVELVLEEGEFHFDEIIGLDVVTDQDEMIGKVVNIFQTGANDVWVVEGEKEYMIPYIEDVVKEVNLENGKIMITPMEGLLE